VVFGERCFEANHWRKKTAIAANSGGRDLLDDLPVCGIDAAEELCGRGEWKLLLLQAFQTGRRATNELISIACHAVMSLRPALGLARRFDGIQSSPTSAQFKISALHYEFRRTQQRPPVDCHFYNIDHLATGMRSICMPVATVSRIKGEIIS
jgi:hypothetical protein